MLISYFLKKYVDVSSFVIKNTNEMNPQEHPVIQHTVDRATTRITPACIQRFMVHHLRRILTCIEDTPLPRRIPLITTRRFRIRRRPIPTTLSCRIRIPICQASLNHPLSRAATRLKGNPRLRIIKERGSYRKAAAPKLNRLKL